MASIAQPGCSPGIVPCAPGFRWDSLLCRCVNYDPKAGGLPAPGTPIPGAPAAAATPWYKRPIVLLAGGAVVLYFLTKS